MADNKEVFKIDLDAKEFIDTANKAKDSIKSIGEQESVSNLINTFKSIAPLIAAVTTAGYLVKKALDLTLEAESINRINDQFDILAKNSGIAADTLREGLERAADGLVDTTNLLEAANKGIVSLGDQASRLPEIFEQARKITKVFGGDLVGNFEKINQAIASGQTRFLRSIGLIVDADDANRKYANSLGITVSALSETEKRQALLNAILEKSKQAFSGINESNESTIGTFQRFITVLNDLKETIILALDKAIGPSVRAVLNSLTDVAKGVQETLKSSVGDTAESIDQQVITVEKKIADLQDRLAKMSRPRKGFIDSLLPVEEAKIRIQTLLSDQELLLTQLREKQDRFDSEEEEAELKRWEVPEKLTIKEEGEYAKRQLNASKFEQSLDELRLKRISSEEQVAISIEQVNALSQEKIRTLLELQNEQFRELDSQRALQEIATDQELQDKKLEIAANHAAQIQLIQNQTSEKGIQALQRLADFNKNSTAGMTAAMTAFSKQAESDFNNMSKRGTFVATSMSNSLGSAFLAIGEGSKNAGEAMKDAFLGTIADVAAAEGAKLLAMGLWPPNPLALGAGSALMALSGFLRSQTKSASGSTPPTATVSAPSVGVAPQPGMENLSGATPQLPAAQKAVTVNIMGHYFETPETRRVLTDMIRQESDATQFTIQQIGQGA